MKNWIGRALVCFALVAGMTGCTPDSSTAAPSDPVSQTSPSTSAARRLESALGEFGSNTAELERFLESGDLTWVQKVLRNSQEENTGYTEINALRQITAYMAEKEASPERFLAVCMGTDLLVVENGEYIYAYDQWHTAVCARGVSQEERSK